MYILAKLPFIASLTYKKCVWYDINRTTADKDRQT